MKRENAQQEQLPNQLLESKSTNASLITEENFLAKGEFDS